MAKKVEYEVVDIGAIVRERRERNEAGAEERRRDRFAAAAAKGATPTPTGRRGRPPVR